MLIGFESHIPWQRVVVVLEPHSSPLERLRLKAENEGRLVNAAHGRKVRALIVTDSNHVILSATAPETLRMRLEAERARERQEDLSHAGCWLLKEA